MGTTYRTAAIFTVLCGAALVIAAVLLISRAQAAAKGTNAAYGTEANVSDKSGSARRPSREELKEKLTPQQFHVVCNEGTEPPFQNAYWDNHEPGIYVDVVSGEPLFSSTDKFDSGTGWPSFTQPLEKQNIVEKQDHKLFVPRTEVRSKGGDSHLGHVFDDGPGPTGLRYCINSASLRFIPVDKLEAEGYGQYLTLFGKTPSASAATPAAAVSGKQAAGPKTAPSAQPAPAATSKPAAAPTPKPNREIATLAGGCFWGMEEILRKVPGVISTRVGYTGGTTKNPVYKDLHSGTTGHAEAVEITFDPSVISFDELLDEWFFRMHDPTTKNRQGNDIGTQYRSAIFYASEAQKASALAAIERATRSGRWTRPITTEVTPVSTFWDAEEYHQDYLQKNPGGYTCHWIRD